MGCPDRAGMVREMVRLQNRLAQIVRALGEPSGDDGAVREAEQACEPLSQMLEKMQCLTAAEAYHALVANSLYGLGIMVDGRFVYVNEALAGFTGHAAQELMAMSHEETSRIIHPDDRERIVNAHRMLQTTGKPLPPHELRLLHKDGSAKWVEASPALITYGGQPAVQMACVDITARKAAQEELRRSLQRRGELESIINRSPAVVVQWRVAPGWPVEYVSENVSQFGFTADELTSGRTTWGQVIHPEDLPRNVQEAEDHMREKTPDFIQHYRVLTKSGSVRWVEDWTRAVANDEGELLYYQGIVLDVTEQHRQYAALRQEQERYRALLDHAGISIMLFAPDTTMAVVNQDAADLFGTTPDNLVGRKLRDVLPPEAAEEWMPSIRGAFEKGRVFQEIVAQLTEGGERWHQMIMAPVHDHEGKVTHVTAVGQDITVHKELEKALRRAGEELELRVQARTMDLMRANAALQAEMRERQRLEQEMREAREYAETILNTTQDAIVVLNGDGIIEFGNEAFFRIFAWPREELLGERFEKVVPSELHENVQARWEDNLRGEATPYETDVVGKNGERRSVMISHARMMIGGVYKYCAAAKDVTDYKQAQRRLEESEARFRELFENSPVALMEEDCSGIRVWAEETRRQGVADLRAHMTAHPEAVGDCFRRIRILRANKAAMQLRGVESLDALRSFFGTVLDRESLPQIIDATVNLIEGGNVFEHEAFVVQPSGERRNVLMKMSTAPGHETTLTRCLASFYDITALREAERQLADERQALNHQRTESLAATGRLAAGVAHEINNPLQAIIAQSRLLQDELAPTLSQSKRLQVIHGSIRRIADIVKQLLDLHRDPGQGADRCTVATVVRNMDELVSSILAVRGVRLAVRDSAPDATVPLAASRLTQVLLNLILNAQDAMPKGGVIELAAERQGRQLVITVSDEGEGISPEVQGKLFSPFFTTKGAKGTGLGLSVTHSIVAGAGGAIEALPRQPKGTTFRICLPVKE